VRRILAENNLSKHRAQILGIHRANLLEAIWHQRQERSEGLPRAGSIGGAPLMFASSKAAEAYRAACGSHFDAFEVGEVSPEEVFTTCEAHGCSEIAYSQDGMSGADIYELL
jgi:hypothetical protein